MAVGDPAGGLAVASFAHERRVRADGLPPPGDFLAYNAQERVRYAAEPAGDAAVADLEALLAFSVACRRWNATIHMGLLAVFAMAVREVTGWPSCFVSFIDVRHPAGTGSGSRRALTVMAPPFRGSYGVWLMLTTDGLRAVTAAPRPHGGDGALADLESGLVRTVRRVAGR
jgi:hypothetical protein